MRIDAYNQISQIYRTTGKVQTGKVRASKGSDKLEISQFGKDYQIASRQLQRHRISGKIRLPQ